MREEESQREILLTYTFVLCKLCCVPIKTINKTFIIGPLASPESLQILHYSSKDLQNRQKYKSLRNLNTCGKQRAEESPLELVIVISTLY